MAARPGPGAAGDGCRKTVGEGRWLLGQYTIPRAPRSILQGGTGVGLEGPVIPSKEVRLEP